MVAEFEVGGTFTNEPIRVAWQRRTNKPRNLRPQLVCFTKQTDEGNPYVVPGFWIDSVRKCDCALDAEHYTVTSNGKEYRVGPGGTPFNMPCE